MDAGNCHDSSTVPEAHTLAPADALRLAIDRIGSQSELARRLSITQAAVSRWLSRRAALPAEHVLVVEAATGVSKHQLRPDLYPPEIAAPARDVLEPAR